MNKKIRNDIILISSLLAITIGTFIAILLTRKKDNLIANVYVVNDLVEIIDLSKKENKTYKVNGLHGYVYIETKDGKIAITESNCPHQDCVHMGYVSQTNRPIVCAYNGVYIEIVGAKNYDVEVG